MILDQVALGILGFFVLVGVWRGALASALGVASLVASYVLALLAGSWLGGVAAAATGLPPLAAPLVVGTLAFVVTSIALGVVSRRMVKRRREALAEAPASTRLLDRVGGGAVGLLRGAVVVVLVGWLVAFADAARVAIVPPDSVAADAPASPIAEAAGSETARIAQRAVEVGAGVVLGDSPSGRVTTRLLARPAESLGALREVLASPSVAKLRDETAFWDALQRGDAERALANPAFRSLAYDATLRTELTQLGVVSPEVAETPQAFQASLDAIVRELAPRIEGIANDPEVQALAQDPAVLRALERGDRWSLLRHPGVQRLAEKLAGQG